MNTTLPITFVVYLTTEGFADCSTIYRAMLEHTDRLLPLSSFRHRLASLKITPGREAMGEALKQDLEQRGFEVITASAPWKRGMSHYAEYLKDMRRVSQHPMVYDTPFIMPCDHDYLIQCHKDPLIKVIHRMTQTLEGGPDVLSFRFLRAEDKDDLAPHRVVAIEEDKDRAWSTDWNLQPMIMRSRDYYLANKIIEDNWSIATQMHGEALWAQVLSQFSRSTCKHAVWLKSYAEVVNLGVVDYAEVAKRFNLTIAENPV